jgi:hypothetical protein
MDENAETHAEQITSDAEDAAFEVVKEIAGKSGVDIGEADLEFGSAEATWTAEFEPIEDDSAFVPDDDF